jgi:hypothetical protein
MKDVPPRARGAERDHRGDEDFVGIAVHDVIDISSPAAL